MTDRSSHVLEEALALSPTERAELADRLLASLDAPSRERIDAVWAKEIEARLDAFDRGEIEAIPAEEAIAEALRKARRR